MLDSPATNSAQHGEISCALAGQGAVNTSTRARITARNLWPSIQFLVVLSRSAILFMTFLPSPLLVLQQAHEDPAQLRRIGGVLFAKRVAMCDTSCFLAQPGWRYSRSHPPIEVLCPLPDRQPSMSSSCRAPAHHPCPTSHGRLDWQRLQPGWRHTCSRTLPLSRQSCLPGGPE